MAELAAAEAGENAARFHLGASADLRPPQRRRAAELQALAPPEDAALGDVNDEKKILDEEKADPEEPKPENLGLPATSCLARIGRPIFRLINAPWKVSQCPPTRWTFR